MCVWVWVWVCVCGCVCVCVCVCVCLCVCACVHAWAWVGVGACWGGVGALWGVWYEQFVKWGSVSQLASKRNQKTDLKEFAPADLRNQQGMCYMSVPFNPAEQYVQFIWTHSKTIFEVCLQLVPLFRETKFKEAPFAFWDGQPIFQLSGQ